MKDRVYPNHEKHAIAIREDSRVGRIFLASYFVWIYDEVRVKNPSQGRRFMDPCKRFSQAIEANPLPASEEVAGILNKISTIKTRFSAQDRDLLKQMTKRLQALSSQILPKKEDVLATEGQINIKTAEILELRKMLDSRFTRFGVIGNVSGGVKICTWIGAAVATAAVTIVAAPVAAGTAIGLGVVAVVGGATKETLNQGSVTLNAYVPLDLEKLLKKESLDLEESEQNVKWTDKEKAQELVARLEADKKNKPLAEHVSTLVDLCDRFHTCHAQYSKIQNAANRALDELRAESDNATKIVKATDANTITSKILDCVKEIPTQLSDILQSKGTKRKEPDDKSESTEETAAKKEKKEADEPSKSQDKKGADEASKPKEKEEL